MFVWSYPKLLTVGRLVSFFFCLHHIVLLKTENWCKEKKIIIFQDGNFCMSQPPSCKIDQFFMLSIMTLQTNIFYGWPESKFISLLKLLIICKFYYFILYYVYKYTLFLFFLYLWSLLYSFQCISIF